MSCVSIVANKVTLKGIVNRVFLEAMFSLSIIQTEHPSVLYYAKGVAKVDQKNECRSTRDIQSNPLSLGNSMRGLWQAPMPNSVQLFPVIVEETPSQSN